MHVLNSEKTIPSEKALVSFSRLPVAFGLTLAILGQFRNRRHFAGIPWPGTAKPTRNGCLRSLAETRQGVFRILSPLPGRDQVF